MVIEVVVWDGSKKHAINQDRPRFTLCGCWIPEHAVKEEGWETFPTCLRCSDSVMKS